MKRSTLLAFLLLLCGLATAQELDKIVAIVDKEVILESELNAQIQFLAMNNKIDPEDPGAEARGLEQHDQREIARCQGH